MSKKITIEQASKEVNSWLDYKNVRSKRRESMKENIDNMADAISDGILMIDENKNIIHKLMTPIGSESKVSELVYKPRLSDKMKAPYMKGVANNDVFGMIHANIAALTETPRAVISAMDSEDMDVARSIAGFFL